MTGRRSRSGFDRQKRRHLILNSCPCLGFSFSKLSLKALSHLAGWKKESHGKCNRRNRWSEFETQINMIMQNTVS